MNDDELRDVARAARYETIETTDTLADLALVHQRIALRETGEPIEGTARPQLVRRGRWMAVAAVVAITGAGLVVLGARDRGDSIRTSDTNVRTSAPAPTSATISTAPSTPVTTTAADVVAEPSAPRTIPVDAAGELPPATGSGSATPEVAAGWRSLGGLPDTRPGLTITAAAADDEIIVVAVCDRVSAGLGRVGASSVWWATREDLVWETAAVPSTDRCLEQIVATPLGLYAAGAGVGWRSDDGREWTEWAVGDDPTATAFGIHAVFPAQDGSRVTVLQLQPAPAEAKVAQMWTTTDGVEWQSITDESAREFDSSDLAGVVPGGDGLLAFGAAPHGEFVPTAAVFTSSDGVRWRRVTPTSPDYEDKRITDIVRIDSGYVAVGGDSSTGLMTAWVSPDGLTWARAPGSAESVDSSTGYVVAERVTTSVGGLWAAGTDFDAARDPDEIPAFWVSEDGRSWDRVETDDDLEIVPFEIVSVDDLTLAAWPPDPRLTDEPLQIFIKPG